MLDTKYFKLVKAKLIDDNTCEFYNVYGYPIILKSQTDGRQLAVLQIIYDDEYIGTQEYPMFIERESEVDQKFQLVYPVTKNNIKIKLGRPVAFVITNLTPHYLQFDLTKTNEQVNSIDPIRINQINELRPYASYSIKTDMMNDNRQMLIKTKTEKNTEQHEKQTENLLWITVTPQKNCGEYEECFSNSQWEIDDHVIIDYNNTQPTTINNVKLLPNSQHNSDNNKIVQVGGNTQCDIVYGGKIKINGVMTDIEYDYILSSKKCKFTMSILEDGKYVKPQYTTLEHCNELLNEYIKIVKKKEAGKIIAQIKQIKMFKSEHCVICLCDEPTILFFRCGHICTCSELCSNGLVVCPICRAHIMAKYDKSIFDDLLQANI